MFSAFPSAGKQIPYLDQKTGFFILTRKQAWSIKQVRLGWNETGCNP